MTTELAIRLYKSAERAVLEQFPNLPPSWRADMILDELEHRFGLDMTYDIVCLSYELEL